MARYGRLLFEVLVILIIQDGALMRRGMPGRGEENDSESVMMYVGCGHDTYVFKGF